MTILTSADFPEIRAQLDVTLDGTMLPDSVIAMDAYSGEAEREVVALDPNALTYSAGSDTARRVRLAAIYLTASRLAPALPSIVSDQVGDLRTQLQAVDRVLQASRLRSLAVEAINAYLSPSSPAAAVPFAFGVACGRRGR